ncbi:MAG TPA: glycosyltransferase family 4 protein [Thermoanaerobaculia bacterium]|nr:glycosyltransferase family 4 protein [Thermoanaerobaculia bacterium]
MRPLKVLAVATYPVKAACTRLRIAQFLPLLRTHQVRVSLSSFLSDAAFERLYDRRRFAANALSIAGALLRRLLQVPRLAFIDLLFVQREAMLVGPPLFEWLARRVFRRPLVLDLDDATFLDQESPVYGRLASLLKWRGKTDRLIDYADVVICGSERIAAHVRGRGKPAVILPTIVDTELFRPLPGRPADALPVIGWVGSHSTWPYFERIIPVLERLARTHRFRVRVVGTGRDSVTIRGVEVENLRWEQSREVDDFRTLDIGVYPLPPNDPWVEGKSGLKAIEYLSVGVPYVASPVGIVNAIGEPGRTHLLATTDDEWYEALSLLLRDPQARRTMGAAGRDYALAHFRIEDFAARIAAQIRDAAVATR